MNAAIGLTVVILAAGAVWRQRVLRREERRRSALLHNAHDIVLVTTTDGQAVTFVSSAAERLLGRRPEDWLGRPVFAVLHPDDVARVREQVVGRAATEAAGNERAGTEVVRDVRVRDADDTYRWFDVYVRDASQSHAVRGSLLTWSPVGDRRRLQAELARQALQDPLTGLPNRGELERRLAEVRPARDGPPGSEPARYSVLFVDLDHFKVINDTLGHQAGDTVLGVVAQRLSKACRQDEAVFRFGGDEVVVLLADADEAAARAAAARVLRAMTEPIQVGGTTTDVIATVGVATSGGNLHGEQVLRYADRAMYQAKRAGRGTVAVQPGGH